MTQEYTYNKHSKLCDGGRSYPFCRFCNQLNKVEKARKKFEVMMRTSIQWDEQSVLL